MRSSSSPDGADARPVLRVAGVAALAWLALFAALLLARGGDVSRFVMAGDFFVDATRAPPRLHVRVDSNGYDGQFFHRLALDPWSREDESFGTRFDRGSYRQQRILYPLVARALSLGRVDAAPAGLVAANGLALALLAAFGAAWARRAGASPWLGLALSLQPGLALAFARDLGEPTELAATLGALWLLRSPRPGWAALPLALAALARETSILVIGAVAIAWLPWTSRLGTPGPRPPFVAWAAPLGAWLGWQAWIAARWDLPLLVGTSGRGLSKSGLAIFDRLASAAGAGETLIVVELVGLLALAVALIATLRRSRASLVETLCALLAGALLFTRGESVWREDWAFLRVGSAFALFALLVLAQAPGTLGQRACQVSVALWGVVAAHVLTRGSGL